MKNCRQIKKIHNAFFQWFWEAEILKKANVLEQQFYQLILLYFKSLVAYWFQKGWWIPKENVCNSKSPSKKGLGGDPGQTEAGSDPFRAFQTPTLVLKRLFHWTSSQRRASRASWTCPCQLQARQAVALQTSCQQQNGPTAPHLARNGSALAMKSPVHAAILSREAAPLCPKCLKKY